MIDQVFEINKISDKAYEKQWWKEENEKCLKCINTCRQSNKVKIVRCPKYQVIEIKEK